MAKTLRQKNVNQILYISIGSALAILILFIILFNVFNRNIKKNNIQLGDNQNNPAPSIEQANSQIGKSINEVEDETVSDNLSIELSENNEQEDLDNINEANANQNSSSNENANVNPNNSNGTATQIVANESNSNTNNTNAGTTTVDDTKEEVPDPVFTMPVDGEIVKQFGKEKLLYSNTLKEWTTHLGIDIKADKTTIVKASSDGIVKSIKNDPRYGLTVVIEHDKGYASVYSNLLTAEFVTVDEKVKSGQTIGTVGNSATFEIVDDPHLHFEITKDGENIDPEMYIK